MALTGLQALTSGFGMGTGLAGGAGGGLASLGFGPLAAITAIPSALSLVGNTMAGNAQARARVKAENMQKAMLRADLGRQLGVPEFDFARQGFGQAFGAQLAATNPFMSEVDARDTRSRMAISGAKPYDIALAGRFMGA